jgi:hypothetical protein
MKKFLLLLFIITSGITKAQDTLYSQDFPTAGKTYVLSTGTSFPGLSVTETGINYNWDFSDLGRSSQRIDTSFVTALTNPALAFYFFDNALNSNRANHAFNGANFNLGFTGLTDIFNYYYNSAANYRQPGFGAVVNALPIPIPYIPHDVIYNFPLKFEDEDSVAYKYSFDLTTPIVLSYHVSRKRHNYVDGWGTLTTPYGTFDVLRVKSVIVEVDSIYLASSNLWITIPNLTTHEYKWLGKNFGLPLLQINTNGNDSINQILYQDSVHLTNIPLLPPVISDAIIFPNPASDQVIIRYSLIENAEVQISILTSTGALVAQILNQPKTSGLNFEGIDLRKYNLAPGNYFVKIQSGSSLITRQLQIN